MATLAATALTLADWAKRFGPKDKVSSIIEILSQTNEILDDMKFKEFEDKIKGGAADNKTIEDVAIKHYGENYSQVQLAAIKKEFEEGIEMEKEEHTSDTSKAAEIALDHLYKESPTYYTDLKNCTR